MGSSNGYIYNLMPLNNFHTGYGIIDNDQLDSEMVNQITQLIEKIRDLFNTIKFKNHAEVSIHKELSLMMMIAENKIQER